ncbi:SDR family NAD(P)-dependent oxidoreductase [Akkermansia muciniphila]|uniref:SDR family NAD(P)-dependent oxidoreductase n=1 Tax=Akkermansia muciniphila TaxID=239935 RepID=UPI00122F042E|nr:SDR family oxidoreductase [Akkermansia muciniphila]KAA3385918.1 SDR family oxidoreductase [Akkermansia muciniphila]
MENRTLLVTGASSDMGMELIRNTQQNYQTVVAHFGHLSPSLSQFKEALGEKLVLLQADFSKIAEVEKLITAINELGVLPTHIVHFPFPVCTNNKFHKIPWKDFEEAWQISFHSIVRIAQEFLPKMSKQREGKIVFILSFVVNHMPPKYCAHYVSLKYALLGLMKSLATEYAAKGITVNGVSPAWVQTKYILNQPDFIVEKNAAENPTGKNLTVEDVVPTIAYLLSAAANGINGQNLSITNGM